MEHDFLGLDEFVLEAEKPENDRAEMKLLPRQEEELVMGNWALELAGAREGVNPLGWDVAVFYIYGQQDFIAMSAIEGTTVEELMAKAEDAIARGMRYGRRYSPDNETGEVVEVPAFSLLPISEEQGQEVRFFDYKLPLIYGMCDWFEPLIDEFIHDATVHGIDGNTMMACPTCGEEASVRAVVNFNGNGGFYVIKTETGYAFTKSDGFMVNAVTHVHLRCIADGCEYDECVDLNEHEIDHRAV